MGRIPKWEKDYEDSYGEYPRGRKKRLAYVYEKLKISSKDMLKIIEAKKNIIKKYSERKVIKLTFYITPEGIARPRSGRGIFYVPNMKKFYQAMDKLLDEQSELRKIMIESECALDCQYYRPIPSDMTKVEKILAEERYITNTKKPDWDNLGKGTDMLSKIMLDDCIVSDARVRKFYSFKPRIVIKITVFPQDINTYHSKTFKKFIKRKEERGK